MANKTTATATETKTRKSPVQREIERIQARRQKLLAAADEKIEKIKDQYAPQIEAYDEMLRKLGGES